MNNTDSTCSKNDLNILIFGDSISRNMVDDWCNFISGNIHLWGHNFSYTMSAPAARVCLNQNIKFAMINIYGSSRVGPYYNGHKSTLDDPYIDTELRLEHGLSQYREEYGDPNFIFYRTDLWDLITKSNRPSNHINEMEARNMNSTIFDKLIKDYEWAFGYLRKEIPSAYLGTHTVPKIKWGLHLFHQYQNALRFISLNDPNIFLYDFELLVNNLSSDEYLLDRHHPNNNYSTSFSNIMVNSMMTWLCEHE
eukprot:gene12456-26205_t